MVTTINPDKNRFRTGTGIANIYLFLGYCIPALVVPPAEHARFISHFFALLLTGPKAEAPRGSGDVAAGQLDVQVTSDVDLDELGQPHVVRDEREPLDQPVLWAVREVNDTPLVQWSRFVAANRVLDVKQRLSRSGAKKIPVAIGKFRCSDESNLLLDGVEVDRFQDQPILRGLEPKVLLR